RRGNGSCGGQLRYRARDFAGKDQAAKHEGHDATARRSRQRQRPEQRNEVTSMKSKMTHPAWATAAAPELRLYVAGRTEKSIAAFANLKRICETHLAGQYRIEVVDLTK